MNRIADETMALLRLRLARMQEDRDHARAWCHHWHRCLLDGPQAGPDMDERASDGWQPTVFEDEEHCTNLVKG